MTDQPLILNGAYRLLSPAGSGGTSHVYLAEHVETGNKVAVKVLKRTLARDAEMIARFDREATLLASIKHPNVVGLIAYEPAPEGLLLLLEWVEGQRLDTLMARGPISGDRAFGILRQLAAALAAVHHAGVVHRDLKPENIMLTPEDVVRLLDFGVARFADPMKAAQGFVSASGRVGGTPAYVSPEHAQGRPADARTDVYTFGVVAYQLLSGELPFKGPSDYLFLKQHKEAKPPKLVPVDGFLEGSPLLEVVMQCLSKTPDDRPQNGKELLHAFTQFS